MPKVSQKILASLPKGYKIIPDAIKINPNLGNVAFVAYADDTHNIIQINNQTSAVYSAVQSKTPIWDPADNKYAYIAYKNKKEAVVVINDEKIDNIKNADNFIFSPDGTYIVYHARAPAYEWRLVIHDHVLSKSYGGFFKATPIAFNSMPSFHTIGIKSGGIEFVLIEVDTPETLKRHPDFN